MTKEQIEADIRELESIAYEYKQCTHEHDVVWRAIARLRADLARMEGPAEGFVREWFIRVASGAVVNGSRDGARLVAADKPGSVVFYLDIPIPRVVEVEGRVEEPTR